MPMRKLATKLAAAAVMLACGVAAAEAAEQSQGSAANANCQNTGSFDRWLSGFRQEAASNGISHATIAAALEVPFMELVYQKSGFLGSSALTAKVP